MNDGAIKGDGTSRVIKATLPATYEEFKAACENGTQLLDILFNSNGWAQQPDFLNKANLLKDQTAKQYGYQSFLVSSLNEGDTVILQKNGIPTEFYVCKKSYESDLNTSGKTLFVQKNCEDNRIWNSSGKAEYSNSDVDIWLNEEYKKTFPPEIVEAMGETTFRYTSGEPGSPVSTLTRSVFLLSLSEFGKESSGYANIEGEKLPIADSLSPVQFNGENVAQWTRSPQTVSGNSAWTISANGGFSVIGVNNKNGVRPAFTLPNDFAYTMPVVPNNIFEILSSAVLKKESGIETVLGDKVSQLKVESGSYIGTGTYGTGSQTKITFSKIKPDFVVVAPRTYDGSSVSDVAYMGIFIRPAYRAMSKQGGSSIDECVFLAWSDNSISYYCTYDAKGQLNESGSQYYYIGFGYGG